MGSCRVRSTAQLPVCLRLSAAVAERRQLRQHAEGHRAGLADQRHVCRVLRHAVPRHRQRHVAEHAAEHADRPTSSATFNVLGNAAPNGLWFDTSAFAQPTTVRFGNITRNQFYGPGGKNFDFSLFRSFPLGGTRRLEARIQANNLFNWVVLANPQNNITSGTFGQITGIAGDAALTNAAYRERSGEPRTAVQFLRTGVSQGDRGDRGRLAIDSLICSVIRSQTLRSP